MAFTKNEIAGGTVVDCAPINENFAEIYTELEGFPAANGALKERVIGTAELADTAVTFDKLSASMVETTISGNSNILPVDKAITDYITAQTPANLIYGGGYISDTQTSYGGLSNWETVILDATYGDTWNSEGYFTIPITGTYRIHATVGWTMHYQTTMKIKVTNNGATIDDVETYTNTNANWAGTNDWDYQQAISIYSANLSAGDKLRLQVWGNTNGYGDTGTLTEGRGPQLHWGII